MNIFRFFGDLSHLASIFLLLHKMRTSHSCAGISLKSQILFLVVYISRYCDLLWSFVSVYISVMKVLFLASQTYVIVLMTGRFRPTNDSKIDMFRIEYLLGGSLIMALIFNYAFTFSEIMWSFSIWLESVAILPQLLMLQRTGEGDTLTVHYLCALGLYRALYIPNWLWRYFAESHADPIAVVAGIVQTVLYGDFFHVYYNTVMKGVKFELPA